MSTNVMDRSARDRSSSLGRAMLSPSSLAAAAFAVVSVISSGSAGANTPGAAPAAAPAAASASAPAVMASGPVVLQKAPTLRAMSELASRERIRQANERYAKLFEGTTSPQAKEGQAPKTETKPAPIQFAFEPPPTIRRLLAVYGPVGKEKAEVDRGDGVVVTVSNGDLVDGFRVLAVKQGGIDVQSVRSTCAGKKPPKMKASAAKDRKEVAPCGSAPVQRVSVGGVFK